MLLAAGLPELVTLLIEEYERLANQLAREPGPLTDIRRKLAGARSSSALFDGERGVRELESAFARMWEIWLRGEAPRPFSVQNGRGRSTRASFGDLTFKLRLPKPGWREGRVRAGGESYIGAQSPEHLRAVRHRK